MRFTSTLVLVYVLSYQVAISEGFGVPYTRCTYNDKRCFRAAIQSLDTLQPIDTVYLDFDKTITVNGYSEEVRNQLCQQEYPSEPTSPTEACTDFNATDAMVFIK